MTWRFNSGRRLLRVVAITMVIVVPMPAASQAVMVSAEKAAPQSKDYGGMLHATAARPSFEVATIRPSAPNPELRLRGITMQSDRFTARGSSIEDVIEFAYAVPSDNEVSGGPGWIRTVMFDIAAKPDEAEALVLSKLSSADLRVQMRLMVQSLLEERFHLKVSFAVKDLPVFALVVVKGGFKCTNAASDSAAGRAPTPHSPAGPPPPPPLPPGYVPPSSGHENLA